MTSDVYNKSPSVTFDPDVTFISVFVVPYVNRLLYIDDILQPGLIRVSYLTVD